MRSHGTAVACYRGARPKSGTCIKCRIGNAIRNRASTYRYKSTALGMLTDARRTAKRRQA